MNHTNVIFLDAGGVLFDTPIKGDDRVKNSMLERGYSISKIDSAISKAKQIILPLITNWDEEEKYFRHYYGTIANELGNKELTSELFFFAHYAGNCELFTETKRVLEELCKDYRLAVISNAMPSMDWVFDRLGIRKYFSTIILSAFVKKSKPDDEIYQIALRQANAQQKESLFIDDKLENIEGAERAGIRGLLLERENQNLFDLLKEHQIL